MTLSEELAERGFLNQTTYQDIKVLDGAAISFYWGVDPSADSMTIGNFAAAMMVKHFIRHGHKAFLLVGGATGMIGDPDGKAQARNPKSLDEIAKNKHAIAAQYRKIFEGQNFEIVDNYDWFKTINYLEFLRDVGQHVPMRQMLAREFVQTRLAEDGAGLSYAEFSYSLIQAYDFLHLNKEHNVTLQVCGADQWGNSVAGVDLIRRLTDQETHVWSAPLVVNKTTGVKFGKSEDGAIWLDSGKTSVYKFYQFWLNLDDAGVADYLKIYTLLDKPAIEKVMAEFKANRGARKAQKTLAYEVTKLVHGQAQTDSVQKASQVLFGDANFLELATNEIEILKNELKVIKADSDLAATMVGAGLAASNSAAVRLIKSGAVNINNQKVVPGDKIDFRPGDNLLRCGKNNFAIIEK